MTLRTPLDNFEPMAKASPSKIRRAAPPLMQYFAALLQYFGPQSWWPAKTRLEVILGAILTQNTNWRNAAEALRRLRGAGLMTLSRLQNTPCAALAKHIRPAGYYRQKATTIRAFLAWLQQRCGGSLQKLFTLDPHEARRELLKVKGLGPETVDAILLYAGGQPFFVADAYTRRILSRHGLVGAKASYAETQALLHECLPPTAQLFNEFHALLVEVGKKFCWREEPQCVLCPLRAFLPSLLPARGHLKPSKRVNLAEIS